MVQRNQATPWVQTNLGASVAGGALVLVLGALGNTLFDDLPNWLRWVVSGAAFVLGILLFSAINEKWRTQIWLRVGEWLSGLRPVTVARLRREVAEERAAADSEYEQILAAQRSTPRPPAWRIRHDQHFGRDENDNDAFWLTNMGFPVTEVEVTGDPTHIGLPHRVIFQLADHGTGQWFAGNITEQGRRDGVTLTITHRNSYGELGDFEYRLSADQIAEMGIETRSQSYDRGRKDGIEEGHAAGVDAGRQALLSEIDSQRTKLIRKARWAVVRMPNGSWTLSNTSMGSVATDVSLNALPAEFTFFSAADWESMTGVISMQFEGMAVGAASHVAFEVEWNDEHTMPQTTAVHWYPPARDAAGPLFVTGPPFPHF